MTRPRGPAEFCSRCGNYFPPHQVCGSCVTDADRVRSAAAVLRKRMEARGRKPFLASVLVRTLERWADREETR